MSHYTYLSSDVPLIHTNKPVNYQLVTYKP